MRKTTAAVLAASAIALPNATAWASATSHAVVAKKKVVTKAKSFTGSPGYAGRWGEIQVTLVVRRTTTTNLATRKKTVKRTITSVKVPLYPDHTDRSIFINQQALPLLIQETIRAQSASIDLVSGATDTSQGFEQSLQSAILRARSW